MRFLLIILLFYVLPAKSQMLNQWLVEVATGTASYNGDLVEGNMPFKRMGGFIGANIKKIVSPKFSIRAGLSYGRIFGDDKKNRDPELKQRNLSFKTPITEFNIGAEFETRSLEDYFYAPYFYAGVGVFHFNPYTFDDNNKKVFLQPLGTEGQGLKEYPNRKKYSRFQFTLPVGGGVKFYLAENLIFNYEFMYHFIFTDYLDDVSTTYIPLDKLSPETASLSFRQQGVNFALRVGERRGDKNDRDVYYYNVIKLSKFINYRSL
jgi:hypothetical protein